jgi:ferredoxin-NADP reductase
VDRLEEGEVSPYLTDVLEVGDRLELRGPIGGYFTWEAGDGGPSYLWPEARAWCRLWP